jgi:hypothetical protein
VRRGLHWRLLLRRRRSHGRRGGRSGARGGPMLAERRRDLPALRRGRRLRMRMRLRRRGAGSRECGGRRRRGRAVVRPLPAG